MKLDYYYGYEGGQYSFYRIPKMLMHDERFQNVSIDAKLLYGMLLDRMSLSMQNHWIDERGRVYIYFSLEEVMNKINCKSQKATHLFRELDDKNGIGLIERIRQGQGKPNIIYVKNFTSLRTSNGGKKKSKGKKKPDPFDF